MKKAFVSIPLLVGIIIAFVAVSGTGAGYVLYEQKKLDYLNESVSQMPTEEKSNDTELEETEELEIEDSQKEKVNLELEVLKLETERNAIENERLKNQLEEQKKQEDLLKQQQEAERLRQEAEKLAQDIKEKKEEEEELRIIEEQKEQEEEEENKNLSEIKLFIDSFWDSPTIRNFENFCIKSKEIITPEIKNILSEDRTQMVDVNKTFYEMFRPCQIYLEKQEYYAFVPSTINDKISFLDSDTDKNRELKIKYNQRIEEIAGNYNFYGFMYAHGFMMFQGNNYLKDPVFHFDKCLRYKSTFWYSSYSPNCNNFISGLIIPEEELIKFQNNYEWAR